MGYERSHISVDGEVQGAFGISFDVRNTDNTIFHVVERYAYDFQSTSGVQLNNSSYSSICGQGRCTLTQTVVHTIDSENVTEEMNVGYYAISHLTTNEFTVDVRVSIDLSYNTIELNESCGVNVSHLFELFHGFVFTCIEGTNDGSGFDPVRTYITGTGLEVSRGGNVVNPLVTSFFDLGFDDFQ